MRNKDKKLNGLDRRAKRSGSASISAPKFTRKNLSVTAVSVALSLGIAYPVFAANEASSPFSAENLAPTGVTTSGLPGGATGAEITTGGSADNNKSPIVTNPSESVIANAQTCAEDMKVIREENIERDVAMAEAGFNVDTFFKEMRSSGCLVSVNDSISLANQITSLGGGSIASVIMSQVQSKIDEAREAMISKLFAKGCEVMLEASQGVFGPINDVLKRYEEFSNPNMTGDAIGDLIDKTGDEFIFNFDKKIDEIHNQIKDRDKNNDNTGGGGTGGDMLPDGDSLGNSTPGQNIDEAKKDAAKRTTEDLAKSRNNLQYPLFVRYERYGDYNQYIRKNIYLHSLDNRRGRQQGTQIGSEQSNNQGNEVGATEVAVCTYLAQISSINNEIRRLANTNGIEDTSAMQIQPINISPAYWNGANSHIRSAIANGIECSSAAVQSTTPPATTYSYGDAVAPSGGPTAPQGRSSLPAVNYGAPTPAPQARGFASAPTTAPSTNEATQYMQNRADQDAPSSTAPNGTAPPAPVENSGSSNPFNKMKSFFN